MKKRYTLEQKRWDDPVDHAMPEHTRVPASFTIPELRAVYEAVKGTTYDPGNFRRRFQRLLSDGVIERAPGKRITASKPAVVYRLRKK